MADDNKLGNGRTDGGNTSSPPQTWTEQQLQINQASMARQAAENAAGERANKAAQNRLGRNWQQEQDFAVSKAGRAHKSKGGKW